jgi:rubrerythrin
MPRRSQLLTRKDVVERLKYLATVEHALVVEYLYARYSLDDSPRDDDHDEVIVAVSKQLREIAIHEMRHFLWVNQVLWTLKAAPSTGLARVIKRQPPASSNRKRDPRGTQEQLSHEFNPSPLTRKTIEWFIEIEKPSRAPDGMYVEILRSITDGSGFEEEWPLIAPTIKLLIDEGAEHWARFEDIREKLKPIPEKRYLRPLAPPAKLEESEDLRQCAQYYEMILAEIRTSVAEGDQARDLRRKMTVNTMLNLDGLAQELAKRGVAPKFWSP